MDTVNNIWIDYGYGQNGSGLTVSFRGQLAQYLGTLGHEFDHYLMTGGHSTYSRVSYGLAMTIFTAPPI